MRTEYKFRNPEGRYFVTYSVVGWIDVFTRNSYKEILLKSWRYCQKHKGLLIHAYVIMTNHVQMIISKGSNVLLEEIMRDMKDFTSVKILEAIKYESESRREWMLDFFQQSEELINDKTRYQLWQQDCHPIECDTDSIFVQKLDYLHENPTRAGFVEKAEDWIYSSAGDYYANKKGLVEMEYI